MTAHDPVYIQQAREEAAFFARCDYSVVSMADAAPAWANRLGNEALTGNPETTWLADLIGRGPFRSAAALGCSEGVHEKAWLRAAASRSLDVYELSDGVIAKVRSALAVRRFGITWAPRRVRFTQADLNFIPLPTAVYDVVWSSGCIHHVTNLEYLFDQVARSLVPGGLFAFNDYAGERRLQYSDARLAAVNDALSMVPIELRFGRIERVTRPNGGDLSPFCAVRSDEILKLARERFDLLHLGSGSALFPLPFVVDLHGIEQRVPDVIPKLLRAEAEAASRFQPCGVYAVLRKPT